MIEIAKILKPQGLRGEMKISMYVHDLGFWSNLKTVYIDGYEHDVVKFRYYKGFGYIVLEDVTTCEQAEMFRNITLTVPKEQIPLADGEYLISDLENCTVIDEQENIIGYVESVEQYGSAYIINILKNGGLRSFPFLNEVIKNVNIQSKKIVVFKNKLGEVLV